MNNELKAIDLTHSLSSDVPTWDGDKCFSISVVSDYTDCVPPNLFRTEKIETKLGVGTHMDAPAHCIPGGKTIDMLDIENLVTDCVVIRVDDEASENYRIPQEAVHAFEKEHGKILEHSIIIFYTGWSKYWENPKKYHNDFAFPGVDVSTAEILLKRNIVGLGIDTFSCDTGKNGFPVHRVILGAGKYLVENITNAKNLPPVGAKIMVMPIKIKGGTEAPIRLIALI